ncbi:MAG: YdcF family protein, partial [Mesorhizobium sp.]
MMDARDSSGMAGQLPLVITRSRERAKPSRLAGAFRISAFFLLVLATLFAGG